MNKNVKITIFSSLLLSLIASISCVPQGLDLPARVGQTAAPNTRTDLCNLLLTTGGNQADVNACLTATTITDADKARLCALSGNLSDTQKETLRTNLTQLGVSFENSCPVLNSGTPSAVPTTDGQTTGTSTGTTTGTSTNGTPTPSAVPTSTGTTTGTTGTPVPSSSPTASNAPIPSASPSTGTGGGGGGSGSQGCGSGTCSGGTTIPPITGTVGSANPSPSPSLPQV